MQTHLTQFAQGYDYGGHYYCAYRTSYPDRYYTCCGPILLIIFSGFVDPRSLLSQSGWHKEKCMRTVSMASLAAAVIGLCTASPLASSAAVAQNATRLTQLAQGHDYGGNYYGAYRPACPERYYYTCWLDSYGYRHCGCRPGFAYYLFRFY